MSQTTGDVYRIHIDVTLTQLKDIYGLTKRERLSIPKAVSTIWLMLYVASCSCLI
jgi:hypothetical protein